MNSPHIQSNVPHRGDSFGRCAAFDLKWAAMAMKETAETWIRIDLFCDGLGDDGICVGDASNGLATISDVAPTAEGARKGILNAAVKSRWWFDPKLQRALCPECVAARDGKDLGSASGRAREARSTDFIDTRPAVCP
jgi:hypothetical protein